MYVPFQCFKCTFLEFYCFYFKKRQYLQILFQHIREVWTQPSPAHLDHFLISFGKKKLEPFQSYFLSVNKKLHLIFFVENIMLHEHSSMCKDKFEFNFPITLVLTVSHAGKICMGGGGGKPQRLFSAKIGMIKF